MHTQGPWHHNIVFAGRNTHVAAIKTDGLSEAEIEANCNLVTAAPAYLADDLAVSPSGAWEAYAAQSARLARADRLHNLRNAAWIALAVAVDTAVAFGLGVLWGRS